MVERLDISAIDDAIQAKDPRGERPYPPQMMLSLLVYGYCTGAFSSRKIERKTHEDIAFRHLALVCTCHNVRKLWVARRAERLSATA